MSVEAAHDFIIGEELEETMTEGGLHIPATMQSELCRMKVLSVGPGVHDFRPDERIKPGVVVRIPRANVRIPIMVDGKEYLTFPAQFVVAVETK